MTKHLTGNAALDLALDGGWESGFSLVWGEGVDAAQASLEGFLAPKVLYGDRWPVTLPNVILIRRDRPRDGKIGHTPNCWSPIFDFQRDAPAYILLIQNPGTLVAAALGREAKASIHAGASGMQVNKGYNPNSQTSLWIPYKAELENSRARARVFFSAPSVEEESPRSSVDVRRFSLLNLPD